MSSVIQNYLKVSDKDRRQSFKPTYNQIEMDHPLREPKLKQLELIRVQLLHCDGRIDVQVGSEQEGENGQGF